MVRLNTEVPSFANLNPREILAFTHPPKRDGAFARTVALASSSAFTGLFQHGRFPSSSGIICSITTGEIPKHGSRQSHSFQAVADPRPEAHRTSVTNSSRINTEPAYLPFFLLAEEAPPSFWFLSVSVPVSPSSLESSPLMTRRLCPGQQHRSSH